VLGAEITARVASLRRIDWDSLGFNFALVFDPASLRAAPYSWMATVTPPSETGFVARVTRAFPTVSVVRVKDVVADVNAVLDQMAAAIRVAASVAILAGIAVLVGAVAAQAEGRTADNVLLKLLGATRRQLLAAAGLEYLAVAGLVAVIALVVGAAGARMLLVETLGFDWNPDWLVVLGTVAGGAAAILILGLVGAARTLGVRIAPALRDE
jgi:putative ABC transport system permease protein